MQNWEKRQKMHAENEARTKVTLQKRFFMILRQFWDPEITKKQSKERYKKEVEKRVLGPIGP